MTTNDAVCAVLDCLDAAKLPHMVTGGLAANHYGVPRATNDADIIIQMEAETFAVFARSLPAELSLDQQISFETITGSKRYIISLAGTNFRIELFFLGEDAHHQERFRQRARAFLDELNRDAWIPRAEDLIIQKLRWFRDKDRDDLRNILAVQGDALDFAHIHRWCDVHGTRGRLEEIQRSIPPI